ncbi:hypothetical protein [Zobellia galactanivorans]|uniref:hypothetical protein n=1 Tax=Zobellia galactanivorans (strain DSM 12802 / CCUG 47099 / CIP 106680 / NCIMB 13871 / Dsij) TaxID=63186 RepID=UPI00061B52D1|nr:hypothetical protein [Zobellia galactanivorans]MBU3027536.1 hypothetical protein [Zobellia galactanivorans]
MIPLLLRIAARLALQTKKSISQVRKKLVLKNIPKRPLNIDKPSLIGNSNKQGKTKTKIKKELRKNFIEEFFKEILKFKSQDKQKEKKDKVKNKKSHNIFQEVFEALGLKKTFELRSSRSNNIKSKDQGPELKTPVVHKKKAHKTVDYWNRFGTTLNKLKPGAEIEQGVSKQTTLSRSRSSSISMRR